MASIRDLIWPSKAQETKTVKLNVGSASVRRPGFLNVDIRPDSGADIVSAAWDLADVPDGSVEEIYSRHMLEHLDPNDAKRALARWFALLRPSGSLNVIVPDLEFHARQLLGTAVSAPDLFPDQVRHAMAGFYGWRMADRGGDREDAHNWGYVELTLAATLREAGFGEIVRQLSGEDSEPWHLNMRATKSG